MKSLHRILWYSAIYLLAFSNLNGESDYWNQFRGPQGNGVAVDSKLPLKMSDTKNIKWAVPVHDKGWSSPVIWGNQIWVTTAKADGTQLYASCFNLSNGKLIRDILVFEVEKPQDEWNEQNSHASPTPVIEEGKIYLHFGSYGTACLDSKTGKKLWERRDLKCDHRVRAASSPITDKSHLYLTFDGVDQQYIIALDKSNGDTVWRQDRDVKSDFAEVLREGGVQDVKKTVKEKANDNRKSYATPTIITHNGQRQLVSPAAEMTFAYDPNSGKELWKVKHEGWGWNVTCRPLYANGLVYLTTGISKRLIAVDPSGRGDISKSHVKWTVKRGASHIPSPLVVNDLVFMVNDGGGMVTCLDALSGEQIWRERLGGFQNHWASPLYADEKVYLFSKEGDITIIKASREFEILERNKINDSFIAGPAVAGNSLILRSQNQLYHVADGFERSPSQLVKTNLSNDTKKESSKSKLMSLNQFGNELKKAITNGSISEEEAKAKYDAYSKKLKSSPQSEEKIKSAKFNLEEYGKKLKQAVDDGIITDEEAIEKYKAAANKLKKNRNSKTREGTVNFYAIVIGKLRTKDIELGEFTMRVDYVTSMYGNRWVKDEIVGKTIKVSGVSGEFRDNLLLIKRGETLKFRSGSYLPEKQELTFGSKFHVLEKTKPFKPEDFGIPPDNFRGFSGILSGKIIEAAGYEIVLEVNKVKTDQKSSKAKAPQSIVGKRIQINGFYNQHSKAFEDLNIGDSIELSTRHSNPQFDSLSVTQLLKKLD